jgi:hypothetical protein
MAIVVVMTLLLAWSAWMAAQNGLSGLYARPAIDYLEGKRFEAYALSEAEWQAIQNNLTHADKLMPGNPQYLEALGLLQQLKLTAFNDELNTEEMDAHANAAITYFQQAIEGRPTWPYYWANLALEHHRRGNFQSDEYSLALANTSRFGPWKNDTQRLVIDLGSETWEFLSLRAKREFLLSVERGLHRQPQNTIRIVLGYGIWPKICNVSGVLFDITLPHIQALCTSERFSE